MKLKSFSERKDWRIPIGQLPPCYQKEEPLFLEKQGKEVSLYAIHISFTRVYS